MRDLNRFATVTERRIATALVDALLAGGYALRVNDGLYWVHPYPTTSRKSVLDALASTGRDTLAVYEDNATGWSTRRVGWVLLIWGNGEDLISDYHTALDSIIASVPVPS